MKQTNYNSVISYGNKNAFCAWYWKKGHPEKRAPNSWWRHQMGTISAWLAICAGNSPVPGEFPAQRPVTRSFNVFFDLRLNKRLIKPSWGWWFETLSHPLWRHCNVTNESMNSLSPVSDKINTRQSRNIRCAMYTYKINYRKTSSINRTNYQIVNVSHLVSQLSLLNPLKPNVKLRMKM